MRNFIFICSILLIISCEDIENCDANDEQRVMILQYLDQTTNQPVKVNFTVTASGSPYQFIPFDDSTSIPLPLDPNATSVTFNFDSVGSTASYELEISYETQLSIFDESCDPSFIFLNLDTVRYSFDSLSIPGRITNRELPTNVQVFF